MTAIQPELWVEDRAGATETAPVADEHGRRIGPIVDPFAHEWEIGKPSDPTRSG